MAPAALTPAPGQSGTFRVSAATPGQPGDLAAAVVLHPSLGQQVAVPLVLRSLIAIQNGRSTSTDTLRGGDGFGPVDVPGPAQISTYRFEIPAGPHDFGLSLTLSGNPDEQVFGYLEDPHGQLLSQQVNVTGFDANGNAVFGPTLQEYRSHPEAGRWTFVVFVFNPVSGAATRQPFVGQIQFNAVDIQAAGLPDSPGTTLPAGQPVTATVAAHNTGAAPESFFADPRSTAYAVQRLIASGPETGAPLPQHGVLNYQVPTQTSLLTATASATAPITLDLFSITFEPEVLAAAPSGATAVAAVLAPEVQPGPWSAGAGLIGPFPPSGAPPRDRRLRRLRPRPPVRPGRDVLDRRPVAGLGPGQPAAVHPAGPATGPDRNDHSDAHAVRPGWDREFGRAVRRRLQRLRSDRRRTRSNPLHLHDQVDALHHTGTAQPSDAIEAHAGRSSGDGCNRGSPWRPRDAQAAREPRLRSACRATLDVPGRGRYCPAFVRKVS